MNKDRIEMRERAIELAIEWHKDEPLYLTGPGSITDEVVLKTADEFFKFMLD